MCPNSMSILKAIRCHHTLSIEQLATAARVDVGELQRIESDPDFVASPRTVYQLENYFKLKPRSLAIVMGLIITDDAGRSRALKAVVDAVFSNEQHSFPLEIMGSFPKVRE